MRHRPYIASIVGKKRGNQTYCYLAESARVNGKPRIVAQDLGNTAEVIDVLSGEGDGARERTSIKGSAISPRSGESWAGSG